MYMSLPYEVRILAGFITYIVPQKVHFVSRVHILQVWRSAAEVCKLFGEVI
jgi:hypothetical protein